MTYEIYRYIFFGGAILAGIMLVVSVIVFFRLNIRTVIGDLSGVNARKAIEKIKNDNVGSGEGAYYKGNREGESVTSKISPSGKMIKKQAKLFEGTIETEKIGPKKKEAFKESNETTVLDENQGVSPETTVLTNNQWSSPETTVLTQGEALSETTVLGEQSNTGVFMVEYEIVYIHTDEIIA